MWALGNISNANARRTRTEDDSDLFYFVRFVLIENALQSDMKHIKLTDKAFRKEFWSETRGDRKIVGLRAAALKKSVCLLALFTK
jgi:hypothetical protein